MKGMKMRCLVLHLICANIVPDLCGEEEAGQQHKALD